MFRTTRTEQRDETQPVHLRTLSHVGALVLALACSCDSGTGTGPDANPEDIDSDGILNINDNCESTYNADQHDEDLDRVGDACDNCPAIENAGQFDTTEVAQEQFPDGVGDACDLRTGLAGDKLVEFYSFAEAAQASSFTGSGWTIAGDAAHADGTARWTSTRGTMGNGLMVVAHIASLTWITSDGSIELVLDGDGISAGGVCTFTANQELRASEPGGASNATSIPTVIPPGQPVKIVAWRSITDVTGQRIARIACIIEHGGAKTEVEAALTDDIVSGSQVLATTDAMVDMSSLSVYTSPGPKNP